MQPTQLLSGSAKILAFALLLGPGLLAPSRAHALQPLPEFLAKGREAGFDAREQAATTEQRSWERNAALGRLLPALSARGVYQYNQFEVQANFNGTPLVISPQNQFDAYFQLDVPLVDVSNFHRYSQAKHLEKASVAEQQRILAQIDISIAQAYYLFVGTAALVQSAERSVQSAEQNAAFVTTRSELGAATELDSARARANVEIARQDLADAKLGHELAGRNLETLSGIAPEPVEQFPAVNLEPEGPLSTWLNEAKPPAVEVQKELSLAAVQGRKAAKAALLPSLSANGQERLTNATGFIGQASVYTLQAVLTWRLDYTTYATGQAQAASAAAQAVRGEKTERTSSDAIFEAHHRVETGIVKSRSARAQADAARQAASLADERYRAGAATQLDVTQAQRDAFAADAALIQADAQLAFARVQLRSLSGKPLDSLWAATPPSPTESSPSFAPQAQP